jgi:hypothetical protein
MYITALVHILLKNLNSFGITLEKTLYYKSSDQIMIKLQTDILSNDVIIASNNNPSLYYFRINIKTVFHSLFF